MCKFEKMLARFLKKPKDFTWNELIFLLAHLGFTEIAGSGSRRKFIKGNIMINLHEPHPQKTILVCYIKQIIELLKRENII